MGHVEDRETGRRYGGLAARDRRAQRRASLLAAALEICGTRGRRELTVRNVCQAAELTSRYFYESFAGRDALLAALYAERTERIVQATYAAVAAAPDRLEDQARAGMHAFVRASCDDPRVTRVVFVESAGVRLAFDAERNQVINRFARANAELVARRLGVEIGVRLDLGTQALAHACVGLLVNHALGLLDTPPDAIADLLTDLFLAAYRQFASEVS
ncbi:hypothetical protein GCM10027589_53350 [Actinocorallia lasiicapitis]